MLGDGGRDPDLGDGDDLGDGEDDLDLGDGEDDLDSETDSRTCFERRCGWARSKEADLREDAEMERICEIQSFVVFSKSQHVLPQPIFKRSEAESEKERGFERDVVSFAVAKELDRHPISCRYKNIWSSIKS